jgi:tetratricopeptide (TPR) repeat protein
MKLVLFIIFATLSSGLLFSQNAEYYDSLARVKFEAGNYESALKEITKAVSLDTLNTKYINTQGYILEQLKMYQDAYYVYSYSISIDSNINAYFARADILRTVGKYEYSLKDYNYIINSSNNDTVKRSAYTNRSNTKSCLRDFQGAYEDLIIAYSFDSTDLAVLNNLGTVCDEIGKDEEGLKYLLKAIEIDSLFYPTYGNIGFMYQNMGEYSEAIKYFDKVLEFNPDEPLGYSNRSYNLYKCGDLKGALKDINKSIMLYPSNSYAYRVRALIYLEKGNMKKACENVEMALQKGFTQLYGDEMQNLYIGKCKKQ